VYERRLGRDRKVDDALHGDKEVFVTAAYKAKLREDELWQASLDAKCARAAVGVRSLLRAHANSGACRDKRDAKNSALAQGNMNGVLNLLSTALHQPEELPAADSAQPDADAAPSGDAALQADLLRRADVKYQKAVAEMDKHELARHKIELRLQAQADEKRRNAPAAQAREASAPPEAADAERPADEAEAQPAQTASEGGTSLKRRADETTLSAAKQRYLARKNARVDGS